MQRRQGYLAALAHAGIPVDARLTVPAHFGVEAAAASVDSLINRKIKFDGIVAASDLIAIRAIRAPLRAGLSVPDDVSVVGYDDISLPVTAVPRSRRSARTPRSRGCSARLEAAERRITRRPSLRASAD